MGIEPGGDPARASGARELLDPDRVVNIGAPLAAVGLGELETEEAQLADPVVKLAWELARLLPLVDVGGDLVLHEAAHRLAQLLVLLAEGGQDRALPGVLDDGAHSPGAFQSSIVV